LCYRCFIECDLKLPSLRLYSSGLRLEGCIFKRASLFWSHSLMKFWQFYGYYFTLKLSIEQTYIFIIYKHFHPSLIFVTKARTALVSNSRLRWKCSTLTNTLAYNTALILTSVRGSTVAGSRVIYILSGCSSAVTWDKINEKISGSFPCPGKQKELFILLDKKEKCFD
jgi:hypothetical protein